MTVRHQQEALGFMVERESGDINDRYRLWETKTLDNGNEEYGSHDISHIVWPVTNLNHQILSQNHQTEDQEWYTTRRKWRRHSS